MRDELRLCLELLETLEAQVPRQRIVLFAHVRHEKFVCRELFVTAFARHRLVLVEELEMTPNEIEACIGQ